MMALFPIINDEKIDMILIYGERNKMLLPLRIYVQLASKKTGNCKFNLSIYVNLCLFDSSISDT
jgi:hypothetical protein